jgi:MerR-like DNA binding protein
VHPYISMMNGNERCREALAEAERRRLARQARQVIRRFRDLGMPLDEIRDVLHAPDAAVRANLD